MEKSANKEKKTNKVTHTKTKVQSAKNNHSDGKRGDKKIAKSAPEYLLPSFNRTRITPRTDEELDIIAHDLILWAQQDDNIVFEEFAFHSGTHNARLYEWAQRHKGIAEAIAIAKQLIGSKRERRALEGNYNASIVMGMMGLYNPEYRAYRKELSQQQEQKQAQYNIIIDKVESSSLVPPKKEENNNEVV